MNEEIRDKLDSEISSELNELALIEKGSNEYKNTVEGISKLIDKRNELERLELDIKKHELSELMENNKMNKEQALSEYNEKDQLFKNIISISSIIIPVIVTVWGTYKTLKFEETGTVTTIMGRGFINKLIPKK